MNQTEKTREPLSRPEVSISADTLKQLSHQVAEESQVIIHGTFIFPLSDCKIRIRPTTFLIAGESGYKSQLIHCEKISLYPEWTDIRAGEIFFFTLVFKGLPADCSYFDLKEEFPGPGKFQLLNIKRNQSDVYRLNF